MRRYPTERLHDPGSDKALCSAPSPPRPGRWGWRRRGLGGPRRDVLRRWVPCGFDAVLVGGVVVAVGGRGRGGAVRRLVGFLAGVRRTKIEAGRYKAGWMRLSAGGRKRGVAALVAGTRRGPRGGGRARAWRATATAGDRTTARGRYPPVAFRTGGYLLPPPVDRHKPVDGDGSNGGDKKYYKSNMSN